MSTSRDIFAVVEVDGQGRAKRLGLELVSKAAELAGQTGGRAVAVVFGSQSAAEQVGQYGASQVYYCDDPRCAEEIVGPPAAVLASLIQKNTPWLVLLPATPLGKDWAGRVSGKLTLGIEANVTDLQVSSGKALITSPVFSGSLLVSSGFSVDGEQTGLVVVLPGSFEAQKRDGASATVEQVAVPDGTPSQVKVVERKTAQGGVPNLAEAQIIVAGGRGLGGADNVKLVQELADTLGGAVGATRAMVDSGWIPYAHQIGQTGKSVKPKLYLAVGVSGEIQHKVGMQTSNTIIAINTNPEAPIMSFSDLAVVGDLFKIVPALTEELKRRKANE